MLRIKFSHTSIEKFVELKYNITIADVVGKTNYYFNNYRGYILDVKL